VAEALRVWRICRRSYASFDGRGAGLTGGRWSHPGVAIVYTSATLSLAILEQLVHLASDDFPAGMVAVSADIPDTVPRMALTIEVPDRDWRRYPSPTGLCDLGSRWVTQLESAVLSVPSAIVPAERNYLLNPRHPAFKEIRVNAAEPLVLRPHVAPTG
jgi:RES domain-containing protein